MCIFGKHIFWLSNSLKVKLSLKYKCFYSDVCPIQECAQYVRQRYHIEVEGLGPQGFRFKWIRKYCLHTIRNLLKSESYTIRRVRNHFSVKLLCTGVDISSQMYDR